MNEFLDIAEVARLEEARQARAMSELGPEVCYIGGTSVDDGAGVATRAEPGSWHNNAVNLGMSGPVDRAEIAAMVEWYTSKGIEPRIELCPYAHTSVARACAELGFVLKGDGGTDNGAPPGFESVLFRSLLDVRGPIRPLHEPAAGTVRIATIDPKDSATVAEFCRVSLAGFLPAGVEPTQEMFESVRRTLLHPSTVAMAAYEAEAGRMIGNGACAVQGEVVAIFGATVVPDSRRRGVQQALLAARLNHGVERGAKVATIGSRPGVATERNVRRMGFQVAYTKVILVKQGPGLMGMVG